MTSRNLHRVVETGALQNVVPDKTSGLRGVGSATDGGDSIPHAYRGGVFRRAQTITVHPDAAGDYFRAPLLDPIVFAGIRLTLGVRRHQHQKSHSCLRPSTLPKPSVARDGGSDLAAGLLKYLSVNAACPAPAGSPNEQDVPLISDTQNDMEGRRGHYSHFYGLTDLPHDGFGIVAGNCQAESLRIFLDGPNMPWVRMPAIHELVDTDIPHLNRALAQATMLVSQPIQDDYHGLPIGTRNLVAGLRAGTPAVIMPVIRFSGLYPTHVIIRPPLEPGLAPPIVAYHDLRTLMEAADRLYGRPTSRQVVTPAVVRAVGERSLEELRSREARHGAVTVSDLFARPTFDQMRTINHPGNSVWVALADRVNVVLGQPQHTVDPGRQILNNVHAPRSAAVAEAYQMDMPDDSEWIVDGIRVPDDHIRDVHLRWYADHPDVIDAGITRHRSTLELMDVAR